MTRRILRSTKRKPGDLTSEDLHQGEMFEKDIESIISMVNGIESSMREDKFTNQFKS